MRSVVFEGLGWWLFTFGLWCTFISSITAPELVTGGVAGLIAGLVIVQLRITGWAAFRPALRWVAWLPTFAGSALAATFGVFAGLGRWVLAGERDIAGFHTVPFGEPGDNSRTQAHRALGGLVLSATPGSYVVRTYPERGEARIHDFGSRGPDLIGRINR